MRFIFLLIIFKLFSNVAFAETGCAKMGLSYKDFFDETVKKMIDVSNSSLSQNGKISELKKTLEACVDVVKISKRVLGRAKWNELGESKESNLQERFVEEYKKYFIFSFGEMIIASLKDVNNFTFKQVANSNIFNVTLHFKSEPKKTLTIGIMIESQDDILKIVDGKFADVSFVQTQRDMFNRLYDENKESIKNFKAENYIKRGR